MTMSVGEMRGYINEGIYGIRPRGVGTFEISDDDVSGSFWMRNEVLSSLCCGVSKA